MFYCIRDYSLLLKLAKCFLKINNKKMHKIVQIEEKYFQTEKQILARLNKKTGNFFKIASDLSVRFNLSINIDL